MSDDGAYFLAGLMFKIIPVGAIAYNYDDYECSTRANRLRELEFKVNAYKRLVVKGHSHVSRAGFVPINVYEH